AVDDDVERQLLGPGGGDALGHAGLHAEDAWRVVHRPGQVAGEDQVGLVLGRIGRLAPGGVLHAARALAADGVGIGPAQARVLDGLVGVDRHLVFRRRLDDVEMVAGHVLALVPGQGRAPVAGRDARAAGVGDIAGLHRMPAEALHLGEGGVQLLLVVEGVAAGFVVADDLDALLAGVSRDALDIEVRVGFGEAVAPAGAEPLAVPADVPALDEHSAEAVLGGEVDVAHGVFGGRAVLGTRVPAAGLQVHVPPDADVLHRLEPADVAQLVGLVEVQDQAGFDQSAGLVGDLQGAPGGDEGGVAHDRGAAQARRQHGAELAAFDPAQVHARVVDQGGFVDRQVG